MTDISITIDETANGETVYCKELDAFLQIYIIQKVDIEAQRAEAQLKIDTAQKALDALDAVTVKRDDALRAASPIVDPLIP